MRRKAASLDALRQQIDKASAPEEANYPRWVRINALKSSIEDQLETTFAKYHRAVSVQEVVSKPGKHLYIDPHVPNLVAVTSGTDLTKTKAYSTGEIILQDKASCFPAYLLDPRSEDGDVIDACAAPGNKTTHLASIIHDHRPEFESPPQTIYAFEKDPRRAQTLEKMVGIAGSKKMTRIALGQDFLQVDPNAERFKEVGALLLDPSCSGSGIVGRDFMPELHLPELLASQGKGKASGSTSKGKRKHDQMAEQSQNIIRDDDGNEVLLKSEKDMEARLQSLSSFQLTLLLHAFRFPGARKVTYSTCSVHSQENENVVMKALGSDIARERGWRILPRESQVTGMKDWPVRGLVEACEGDKVIADDASGRTRMMAAASWASSSQDSSERAPTRWIRRAVPSKMGRICATRTVGSYEMCSECPYQRPRASQSLSWREMRLAGIMRKRRAMEPARSPPRARPKFRAMTRGRLATTTRMNGRVSGTSDRDV